MRPDPPEPEAPLLRVRGDRVRAFAPSVLMVAVALLAAHNHVRHDQSSWEGASLGMFATYENETTRLVIVTVTDPDGPFRAALPHDLEDDAFRLRVAPSQGGIDRLARAIADLVREDGATEVAVELWQIDLDDDGPLRLRLDPMLATSVAP